MTGGFTSAQVLQVLQVLDGSAITHGPGYIEPTGRGSGDLIVRVLPGVDASKAGGWLFLCNHYCDKLGVSFACILEASS